MRFNSARIEAKPLDTKVQMEKSKTPHSDAILSGISVVVPVYNSETILPSLLARLEPVLKAAAQKYEVILVNDGSRDGSWSAIQKLCATYSWLVGIDLMRNYGQHNALLCGIRAALYDIIVTMDDDLQHSPEEIPKLLRKLDEGYDVVYGTPEREEHGFWRDMASIITKITTVPTLYGKNFVTL